MPRFPGAFAAWGCSRRRSAGLARPYYVTVARTHSDELVGASRTLQERGALAALVEEGVGEDSARVQHMLDMRYIGQEYTLDDPVAGSGRAADRGFDQAISRRFDEVHDTRFGHANPGAPVEFVSARSTGLGDLTRAEAERVMGIRNGDRPKNRHARSCSAAANATPRSSTATTCPRAPRSRGRR